MEEVEKNVVLEICSLEKILVEHRNFWTDFVAIFLAVTRNEVRNLECIEKWGHS